MGAVKDSFTNVQISRAQSERLGDLSGRSGFSKTELANRAIDAVTDELLEQWIGERMTNEPTTELAQPG